MGPLAAGQQPSPERVPAAMRHEPRLLVAHGGLALARRFVATTMRP